MSRNGGRSRRKVTVSKPSVTPLDETLVEDSSDPENDVKPDKEWSVEAVVARRGYGDEREYNVKWNGWPSEDNTWYTNPLNHILNIQTQTQIFTFQTP